MSYNQSFYLCNFWQTCGFYSTERTCNYNCQCEDFGPFITDHLEVMNARVHCKDLSKSAPEGSTALWLPHGYRDEGLVQVPCHYSYGEDFVHTDVCNWTGCCCLFIVKRNELSFDIILLWGYCITSVTSTVTIHSLIIMKLNRICHPKDNYISITKKEIWLSYTIVFITK